MLPYLYVYILTMILLFFYDVKEFSRSKPFFLCATVFSLSILYYFRDYSIGLDTYTYVDIIREVSYLNSFRDLLDYSVSNNIEIGFILFIYFICILGGGATLVFFISALLIYSNLAIALKKIKINAILYFSAFFSYCAIFIWTFNILRQMIAVSFVILAVIFLLKGSRAKFIFFVLIAFLFHYSAIICLIFYLIYKYLDFIFKLRWFLVGFLCLITKFVLLAIIAYYPRYSSYGSGEDSNRISILLFIFYFLIFSLSGFFHKIIKKDEFYYKFFVSLFSLYIGLQLAFMINGISTFGTTRVLIYFLWPSVFIVGIFLNNIKREHRYILNILIFAFLTFYFVFSLRSAGYDYIPFRFLIG